MNSAPVVVHIRACQQLSRTPRELHLSSQQQAYLHLVQELHPWNLDGNLLHSRNVHHSEDELNQGHEDSNLWTVGTCRC